MAVNKVIFNDNPLIDLTDTTAEAGDVASGKAFYGKDGVYTVGTAESTDNFERVANKVTSISSSSTDVQYPSAKCVYDNLATKMEEMTILTYGSSTWNDFITAYRANRVVYCRVSGRMAFMAYVNNGTNPTEVEFQYYRSVATHSDSQQGDQVFVYKLTSSGTWTTTTREAYTKVVAGTGLSSSYSNGAITLTASSGKEPVILDITNEYNQATYNYYELGNGKIKITNQSLITQLNGLITSMSQDVNDDVLLFVSGFTDGEVPTHDPMYFNVTTEQLNSSGDLYLNSNVSYNDGYQTFIEIFYRYESDFDETAWFLEYSEHESPQLDNYEEKSNKVQTLYSAYEGDTTHYPSAGATWQALEDRMLAARWITGYNANKTQILKQQNGSVTWVDDYTNANGVSY